MCEAPTSPVSILLVEDDEIDASAFMRSMQLIDKYWRVVELPVAQPTAV